MANPPTTERLHVTRSRANPGGRTADDEGKVPFRSRKPPWLKVPAPGGPTYRRLQKAIDADNLHTVCQEANCPNVGECWERGTATFMILGDVCTRRCGFCNVQTGKPTWNDPLEPLRVANQVKRMALRHAVITSVDRDDLPDYGAGAFVGVIRSIRRMAPGCKVEVLTPDFRGQEMPLAKVIAERPDVFNHNVETVPRLYPIARRGSHFLRSARVLRMAKEMGGDEVVTDRSSKSTQAATSSEEPRNRSTDAWASSSGCPARTASSVSSRISATASSACARLALPTNSIRSRPAAGRASASNGPSRSARAAAVSTARRASGPASTRTCRAVTSAVVRGSGRSTSMWTATVSRTASEICRAAATN